LADHRCLSLKAPLMRVAVSASMANTARRFGMMMAAQGTLKCGCKFRALRGYVQHTQSTRTYCTGARHRRGL
jgi:hypothetical protein